LEHKSFNTKWTDDTWLSTMVHLMAHVFKTETFWRFSLQHRINWPSVGLCIGWCLCNGWFQQLCFSLCVTCWSDAILGGTVGSSDSVTFRNTFPTTSLCLVYIYDPCIFWATLATLKIHNSQREELVLCSFGIHLPLAWGILSWWSRIARCIPWHSWVHWSSDGVWAFYSWRLMAPRQSWWSEGFWWALNDCGSLKKCLMYMVWDPTFRRCRMGTLSEHSGLCDLRGRYTLSECSNVD
jgi:hypothetical protein